MNKITFTVNYEKDYYYLLTVFEHFLGYCTRTRKRFIALDREKELSYGNFSVLVPQFDAENYLYNNYSKTVHYSATIKLNSKINEVGFQITNLVFEPIQRISLEKSL